MNNFISLVESVPNVVWSGVIASMLTLSGVFMSNTSSTNRLKLQLKHDAEEKAKERTSILRREVYMQTAEELVKANAHLAGIPQLDLSKTNLWDGLQGFFSVAARLQLVAEPNTVLMVSQLVADYGELVVELMTHLVPVGKAKIDIEIADGLCNKSQTEVSRLLAEMTRLNESGQPLNPQVVQVLNSNFAFHQSQAAGYAAQRSEAWTVFNRSNMVFQRFLLMQLREIGSKQIPVMVEIRRDLGLTGNLTEVEALMKEQWARMDTKLESVISALKASE